MSDKYNLSGAKFGGGFAAPGGIQVGGSLTDSSTTITNEGAENIAQLISSLREIAQSFPEQQHGDAVLSLDDLTEDIKNPEKREPKRIGMRLKRLMASGAAVLALSGGAATVSGNFNEVFENAAKMTENATVFTEKVKQLAGELGFDIGQDVSTP